MPIAREFSYCHIIISSSLCPFVCFVHWRLCMDHSLFYWVTPFIVVVDVQFLWAMLVLWMQPTTTAIIAMRCEQLRPLSFVGCWSVLYSLVVINSLARTNDLLINWHITVCASLNPLTPAVLGPNTLSVFSPVLIIICPNSCLFISSCPLNVRLSALGWFFVCHSSLIARWFQQPFQFNLIACLLCALQFAQITNLKKSGPKSSSCCTRLVWE